MASSSLNTLHWQSNWLLINCPQFVGISPGNDVGRFAAIAIGLVKLEKVWVKTDQITAWVLCVDPLYRCYLRLYNIINKKSLNLIVLRHICLKISDVLQHTGVCLSIRHIHKVRSVST